MEDRELLELAAKACGIRLEWDGHPDQWQPMFYEGKTYHSWNPLEDDGDALRLAISLGLRVQILLHDKPERTRVVFEDDECICSYTEFHGDRGAAESTRLVIAHAAADIGISMP